MPSPTVRPAAPTSRTLPTRAELQAQIDRIRRQRDRALGANVSAAERILRLEADKLALQERLAARESELQELEGKVRG